MHIQALPSELVRHWRTGGPDANGQTPQPAVSDGPGNPCRHCLRMIPEGAPFLIIAHRPFQSIQPYAECGPLFVCAQPCTRFLDIGMLPDALRSSPRYLIRGYSRDERIVYGTGTILAPDDISACAAEIFADPKVAFIHVRSASNNCYQARIDRAP